jgi:diguanylate cyclase (GGDEF)-like protein
MAGALTTSRPLALLLLALCAVPQPARAGPRPPAISPAVVRPGPPSLPVEPGRWLPLRIFPWQEDLKPTATSLAIDAQGYLWAGTPNGPIRYNGRSWRAFKIPHTGAPVAVWPLLAARDGSYWFGTQDRGALVWKAGRWSHFGRNAGITDDKVHSLVETTTETAGKGQSTIWAGTPLGLSRCTEAGCTPIAVMNGLSVRATLPGRTEDGRTALWVGTDKGLLRLDDLSSPQPVFASLLFDHRNGLPDDSVRSLAETVSRDGTRSLWVGTDHGLSRRRGSVWTRYDASSGFPNAGVTALAPSHTARGDPVLWAGTFRAGLARFEEDGRWQLFDASSGLPANYIFALLAAANGSGEPTLWASTAGGIARLDRERWRGVGSREGLPHDTVLGVGEATFPDGVRSYWAGTIGGMVRLGVHGWERFAPDPSLEPTAARQVVSTTADDGSPVFWMGTISGLRRFSKGRWTLFDARSSPLPGDLVLDLLPVPWRGRETLWVGTNNGLARIEGERWTVYGRGSGPPGNEVATLLSTPASHGPPAIWVGTEKGLSRFMDGRWTEAVLPCLPHPAVLSLHWLAEAGSAGWLWIGTRSGVVRLRVTDGEPQPASCEALTDKTDPPLSGPAVSPIQIDDAGRIYLFSDTGVARLTLAPGKALSAARLELFDRDDGLPGTLFTSAAYKDRRGRLWVGSTGGLAIFDPSNDVQGGAPSPPAPLYLEHIRVNGRERPLPQRTVLRHDENSLELDFALLSFHREHATLYRTQLAGLEREPSDWSRDAREVYTRLPPGDYTFRLWGKNADGVVSGPLQVSFAIQRAPWVRPWAISLYALALMGMGYGFNHLRLRRVARRAGALEALVAERTRELAEANAKLEQASLTDPLTGLSNRRFVALNIEPDLRLAERNYLVSGELVPGGLVSGEKDRNRDLLIYLLDIDRFKDFNDRAGHPAGDAVLVELAQRLRDVARASDAVVRWGGEEFLLISRWTDRASGEALATRILEVVGGTPFTFGPARTATVTCSVGWAPYPWRPEAPEAVPFEQVVSLADRALYLAKREGRDRAVGVLPGPADVPIPEEGPLDALEGAAVELTRTPRGSREIASPSLATR